MNRYAVTLSVLAVAVGAHAGTLFSTGFEAPTYTSGAGLPASTWQTFQTSTGDPASFLVTNTIANTGTQSLAYDTAPGFGTTFAWVGLSYNPTTDANKVIDGRVAFRFNNDTRGNSAFAFGAYNAAGSSIARFSFSGTSASFRNGATTVGTSTLAYDTWYSLDLRLNYATNTIAAFINGTSLGTSAFAGAGTATTVTDFDMVASASGYNVGRFDDYSVISSVNPTPEPATVAALGLGALAMLRRRSRR